MFCLNRESCLMGGAGSLPVDSLGASRAVYVVIAIVKKSICSSPRICSSPGICSSPKICSSPRIFSNPWICSSPRIFCHINVADYTLRSTIPV